MNTNDGTDEFSEKLDMFLKIADHFSKQVKPTDASQAETDLLMTHIVQDNDIANQVISFIEDRTHVYHIPEILFYIYNLCKSNINVTKSPQVRILFFLNFIIDVLIECEYGPFCYSDEILKVVNCSFALLETNIELDKGSWWKWFC